MRRLWLSLGAVVLTGCSAAGAATIACPSTTPSVTSSPSVSPSPSPSPTVSPTPSPTSSPTTPSGWPGAGNTGVPAGVVLSAYTGSATLSGGITGKKLVGDFAVSGSATISSSEIDGTIRTTGTGTLSLTDVTIDGGTGSETFIDLQGANITALRVNLHGGNAGFSCADNCSATDSWFHDPYIIGSKHYDAVGSNGVNGFTIRHNTISCTDAHAASGATGGCSADLGFFGDFGVIENVTVDHNLFVASSDSAGYCVITNAFKSGKAYPTGKNLVYTNNVWQRGSNGKCGQYGPVDEWQAGNGNVWSGNTWDDGTALNE